MLTFPEILIGVFGAAGLLLAVILLVVLLPRRDVADDPDPPQPSPTRGGRVDSGSNGRNGEGFTP